MNSKHKSNATIRSLCICAVCAALIFAATLINIRLPLPGNGGLIHLGNVPLVAAAIVFGKKCGAASGAIGMALFDLVGGWVLWAPFTFVIRAAMGFVIGLISEKAEKHGGKIPLWNSLAVIAGGIILVAGYYGAEAVIYGNILAPIASIPGNLMQVASALVLGLPFAMAIKKAVKELEDR